MTFYDVQWSAKERVSHALDQQLFERPLTKASGVATCAGFTRINANSQAEADAIMRDVLDYSRQPVVRYLPRKR